MFTPSNIGIRFLANSVLLADDIDEFFIMEYFIYSIFWSVIRFVGIFADYDLIFFVIEGSNKFG